MKPSSVLQGKHILTTRSDEAIISFAEWVTEAGGICSNIPLVGFSSVTLSEQERNKLLNISEYDWIILTSKNGVEYFFKQMETGTDLPHVACIGDKTAAALLEHGITPQFIPSEFVAESFAAEFLPMLKKQSKVLVAKGNLARDYIKEILCDSGHTCDEIILYENRLPDGSEEALTAHLHAQSFDVIVFASSSAVSNFTRIINEKGLLDNIDRSLIACIGPVTARTAVQNGLYVDICADTYTMEGLFESIIDSLHNRQEE